MTHELKAAQERLRTLWEAETDMTKSRPGEEPFITSGGGDEADISSILVRWPYLTAIAEAHEDVVRLGGTPIKLERWFWSEYQTHLKIVTALEEKGYDIRAKGLIVYDSCSDEYLDWLVSPRGYYPGKTIVDRFLISSDKPFRMPSGAWFSLRVGIFG